MKTLSLRVWAALWLLSVGLAWLLPNPLGWLCLVPLFAGIPAPATVGRAMLGFLTLTVLVSLAAFLLPQDRSDHLLPIVLWVNLTLVGGETTLAAFLISTLGWLAAVVPLSGQFGWSLLQGAQIWLVGAATFALAAGLARWLRTRDYRERMWRTAALTATIGYLLGALVWLAIEVSYVKW